MKWKCTNDWFGYCSREPDGAANACIEERSTKVNGMDTIVKINIGMGATCSLDKKTCGKYQTFEKAVPSSPSEWIEPEVLAKTIVANKKTKKNKGEQKELI